MADRLDTRNLIEELDELDENDERAVNIQNLLNELEENCDEQPRYGIILIPEDDFEAYAEEFARDIGALPEQRYGWPHSHIKVDWEAAAEELALDYHEVEFEGVTYLAR